MGKTLTRAEVVWLLLLTLGAFGVRLCGAGSISLAEDEAGKWQAIQQYKQGHFADVNIEHPMLMKLLAWGSDGMGARWNRWTAGYARLRVSEEMWLRLPNILLGALTTVVLYLLARQMIGVAGASAAAFFWAFTPLPVALNRVLKEDTPLTFFALAAFYFFWRAKRDPEEARILRWLDLSGVCFGLALASKYIIYFFGMNWLICSVAGRCGMDRRPLLPHFWRMVAVMAVAFVLANPIILSPHNIVQMLHYTEGRTIEHHGYNLDGRLYMNTFAYTPYGLPPYFYLWVLAVKTPLVVLLAIVVGGFLLLREPNTMASIFFRTMVLLYLLGLSVMCGKWIRYMVSLLPFVYLTAGYAYEKLYGWFRRRERAPLRQPAFALLSLVLFAWPLAETLMWSPYDQLYLNQLGGGRAKAARYFPHDEVYDLNARQEVEAACQGAAPGATLAVSNPMSAAYYAARIGRPDIRVVPLYDLSYIPRPGDLIVLQDSRRYFETEDLYYLVERHGRMLRELSVNGVVTSRIYRF